MTPQELKNSILQLAIQGKLVEQRPEEGTAEGLYKQIQAEKQALIKAGKIKKEKPLSEIAEDEMPFEIPESWMWVRLLSVVEIATNLVQPTEYHDYKHIAPDNIEKGTGKLLQCRTVAEDKVVSANHLFYRGQIIYSKIRPLLRKAVIAPFDGLCSADMYPLNTQLNSAFLLHFLLSDTFNHQIALAMSSRVKMPKINQDELGKVLLPLPPLAEQMRIVAKIEELLPLIERYEKAWSRLEDFNKRFPVDMQKSILQLAIQGKLVEQRPEEGTGEELYKQIQAEKQALIKAGKIKKEKPLPEITEDEIPFEIPDSWKWVRISDLCKSIADGDHQPPPQVPNGIPFLVISNVSGGSLNFSNTRFVPVEYYKSLSPERVAEKGDILFTVTGSYGIPVKVDCDASFCFQRHMALLKLMLNWDYLFYVLKSPVIKNQCDATATGTAQKTVGLNSLRNMVIPLPPLAEQKRIVAKLEELLPLCERLK